MIMAFEGAENSEKITVVVAANLGVSSDDIDVLREFRRKECGVYSDPPLEKHIVNMVDDVRRWREEHKH